MCVVIKICLSVVEQKIHLKACFHSACVFEKRFLCPGGEQIKITFALWDRPSFDQGLIYNIGQGVGYLFQRDCALFLQDRAGYRDGGLIILF